MGVSAERARMRTKSETARVSARSGTPPFVKARKGDRMHGVQVATQHRTLIVIAQVTITQKKWIPPPKKPNPQKKHFQKWKRTPKMGSRCKMPSLLSCRHLIIFINCPSPLWEQQQGMSDRQRQLSICPRRTEYPNAPNIKKAQRRAEHDEKAQRSGWATTRLEESCSAKVQQPVETGLY